MNLLNEWLDYLDAQVGVSCYVYGAQGQTVEDVGDVEKWIVRRSLTSSAASRAWGFYRELAGKIGLEQVRFFDCSGLAMYFFQQLKGIAKADTNAHGLWRGCEKRSRDQLRPGDFAFMVDASTGRMHHIGYVARDGQIVEARASGYGVEKHPVEERPWTHFGRHKWLAGEFPASAAPTAPDSLSQLTLTAPSKREPGREPGREPEREPGEKNVRFWQNLLLIWDPGCLPKHGADGKYGEETDCALCRLARDIKALRETQGD